METLEKNEPCYVQNHDNKYIETTINIGENVLKIRQRRLNGGERIRYENDLKNVYADKDIYKTLLKQNELEKELERLQKTAKNPDDVVVPIDEETQYLIYKGNIAIEAHNRNINARFIAYSCQEAELENGYILLNDKPINFEKAVKIINELGVDEINPEINWFNVLLANANKLTFPTIAEIEEAK